MGVSPPPSAGLKSKPDNKNNHIVSREWLLLCCEREDIIKSRVNICGVVVAAKLTALL
jgi:hypothetical protein